MYVIVIVIQIIQIDAYICTIMDYKINTNYVKILSTDKSVGSDVIFFYFNQIKMWRQKQK